MSITDTPRPHRPIPPTPAFSVTSSNLKSPLLMYNLFETILPVKYRSCRPSLLKSPTPTPPPLYTFVTSSGFIVSFSVILLLKSTPECEDEMSWKRVGFLQEKKQRKHNI